MIVLNLLSVTLGDILLLASTDNMSAEVELLAVVWEVRESVLYTKSSSPLLSLSPEIDSGGDGSVNEEVFGSAGVGLSCGFGGNPRAPVGDPSHLGHHSSSLLFFMRVCDPLLHCLTCLSDPTLQGQ